MCMCMAVGGDWAGVVGCWRVFVCLWEAVIVVVAWRCMEGWHRACMTGG